MKTSFKILNLIILVFAFLSLDAQPWAVNIESSNPTFNEIRSAFYQYWDGREIEKGKGYKQFKRWEWYWEQRALPDGSFPSPSITWDEWNEYLRTHPEAEYSNSGSRSASGDWIFKGPSTTPGGYNGLGRINCIAFHPTNANTFWVGTPAGGLWKTTNGGSTWTTTTDNLPVLGVSDIAVDPTNPNTMYIATGDGDAALSLTALGATTAGDTKSIGVLKSTDGGNTWSQTGLNWSVTSAKLIRRLIINPNNPQILLAATSDGVYRTINGGTTWSNVMSGYFMDLEFKPGDPSIVYAASFKTQTTNASIYRSTNSGANWTGIVAYPIVSRINIAVTANWPDLVDAVCVNESDEGLAGLIFSDNSGASFTQYFNANCSNNLLHNSYNASGCGGQGSYDLAYAINPNNSDEIWLGGINTWKTTDGGANWNVNTMWNSNPSINPNNKPTVHADKHFFAFHPLLSNTLYDCNDGGLYRTTNGGASWVDLSNGLEISQIYRIGVSQTIQNNIICGLQDNGSREIYNNQWYEQTGGDGMECIIDYTNANMEYASYAYGVIYRTFNFWQNQVTISDNIPLLSGETGAWVTPFVMHPTNPQILYAGYKRLYRTTNQGNTWTPMSTFPLTSSNLTSIAVAPSNSNTIYTSSKDTLYITYDGGASWYFNPKSFTQGNISYLAVHPTNPQILWMTISGYLSGQKVYKSTDGGANWSNISGTLPNLPVNCIVYQNGSNDGIYIGTDVGVFYRNSLMSDWVVFNSGLPNVVVTELEISYNDNRLWAATFGRGLWQSDLYDCSGIVASISPASATICNGNSISLNATGGSSYSWNNGSTSSSINVSPTQTTTYTVTVISSGCSATASRTVNVNPKPNAPTFAPTSGCSPLTVTATSSNCIGCTYQWSTGATGATATFNANFNYVVTVTNTNNCTVTGSGSATITSQPSVAISPANPAFCSGSSVSLTVSPSGSGYAWSGPNGFTSNAQSPSVNTPGSYSVTVTNPGSCSGTATASKSVTQHSSPNANAGNDVTIQQGNSTTLTASGGSSYIWSNGATVGSTTVSPTQSTTYTVTVTDANGCTATDNVTVFVQSGGCNNIYTLSASSVGVPSSGGNVSVNMSTDAGCSWNVNTGGCVSWVTTNNPNGSGSASITFLVQPNTLSSQRTCFATIEGNLFSIIQDPAITNVTSVSAIKNIAVYPNPNKGEFELQIETDITQKLQINLFNPLGQLMQNRELETNAVHKFDLRDKANGIYFLQVLSEDGNYYVKVLVN
jgi:hypothetical protein